MLHRLRKKLDRAASENPIARAARTLNWSGSQRPHILSAWPRKTRVLTQDEIRRVNLAVARRS